MTITPDNKVIFYHDELNYIPERIGKLRVGKLIEKLRDCKPMYVLSNAISPKPYKAHVYELLDTVDIIIGTDTGIIIK